jgi:hypothetical protein
MEGAVVCRRSRHPIAIVITGLVVFSGAPAASNEINPGVESWFEKHSLPMPSYARFIVCHGYGCEFRTAVALRPQDRVTFAAMLQAKTPEAERHGIARVVAWFDKRIAPETGTGKARANAGGLAGDRTQFDCVDRATNTTGLILVLAQWKLLKHHRLDAPVSRLSVILGGAPHSTAVVTELKTGKSFVIDPWTKNSGELPDVMPIEKWLAVYR